MPNLRSTIDEYAQAAAERLGPDTYCSITLKHHGELRYVGSSDERAARCDQVEVAAGEGPCVTAMEVLHGVLVPDIQADERWPAWRDASLDAGFRSSAALPAVVDDVTTVAINLYSDRLDPWDQEPLVAMDAYIQEIAEVVRTRLGS
ncbi:GAF domain-containing protein [Actinotalea ferrariae]|uniref:GAF domain-containing protein n=1 Tax=Actinotalea ferrariae TaxID=1386098 RepID=UPI001C8B8E58|nr:GAF domain-containing protein [Actinotalea ferrariae]MBX9244455.1 GAF domain-containing protein [Actinotalea ferrariae]